MARSRARARVACSAQGQPRGRCKVSLRAERVSRPAREKKRRRRVLVVTSLLTRTDSRRPAGQVVRHYLYRQPGAVGGEAARGEMVQSRRRT